MTARDALGAPGQVQSAPDTRHALAGLLALNSADPLDVRTGVLYAGVDNIVIGNTDTGPMTVSVLKHQWVASKGSSNGPYLGSNDGTVKVPLDAAPGSNSRIDLVWVRQKDAQALISADASNGAEFGVTKGTAGSSPVGDYASVPVGATVLVEVVVPAGATSTSALTITPVHKWTAARGGIVPVRTQAERDAITAYKGMQVWRLDKNRREEFYASAWHGLGDWVSLSTTPGSGWSANATTPPKARLLPGDRVEVVGRVDAGATVSNTKVLTFPASMIPTEDRFLPGHNHNGGASSKSYNPWVKSSDGGLYIEGAYYQGGSLTGSVSYPISGVYPL